MNKDNDAVDVVGKILLPMIRKVTPAMMAQKILSVQPMQSWNQSKVELRCGTAYLEGSKLGDWFTVLVVLSYSFMKSQHDDVKGQHYPWCIKTFGPEDNDTWFERESRFYFRNEEDQTMFVLRWSL